MNSQKVFDIITGINNLYGLEKQGKELAALVARMLKCKRTCLLFLDSTGEAFTLLSTKPALKNNQPLRIAVSRQNPVIEQINQENRTFTRNDTTALRILEAFAVECGNELGPEQIQVIIPMKSRTRLVGILVIENDTEGFCTPDEINLLEDIAGSLATGMEKEYLRERLVEREKELTVLNRCISIVTSSLDITGVFKTFALEVKKILDIEWTVLGLLEGEHLRIEAAYSEIGATWEPGEKMPLKGTATEWVTASKMPLIESDLKKDSLFVTDVYHRKQGLRSLICAPLMINNEAIGSLIAGTSRPNRYGQRQVEFMRELAVQIAMPVENARLYAEVLKKSRFDELTGVLNRRSMDEQIVAEVSRHSRYGGVFSLIILDLDSMKLINDNYGHLAGDGLLARTGSILRQSIRSVDQAFRYGGDEFAIMLPNTPIESAVKVAERVRRQLASRLVVDDMIVTASFGLAGWPANGNEAKNVVAAADAALYRAKRLGGNQSCSASDNPE